MATGLPAKASIGIEHLTHLHVWSLNLSLIPDFLSQEILPETRGMEYTTSYGDHDTDPASYKNQSLLIIGIRDPHTDPYTDRNLTYAASSS